MKKLTLTILVVLSAVMTTPVQAGIFDDILNIFNGVPTTQGSGSGQIIVED